MKPLSNFINERFILISILITGFILRFYQLSFQSFWLDELHTAIEADPSLSWSELFSYLKCCDQHPPLFFAIEKLLFFLLGSSEFLARTPAALAGTASLYVMYLLGKELYNSRLGLVAAAITCFNYFHLQYSQEARPYAFAFLFAGLSFLFLIRLFKNPSKRHIAFYSSTTLLLLYSHYFGLFVLMSQIILGILFWWQERKNQPQFLKAFLISGGIIFIGFSPWFPFLMSMSKLKSFWIQPITPGFAINFFYDYFGNSDLIKPFVFLFLILGVIFLVIQGKQKTFQFMQDQHPFFFLVCLLWIGVTLLIPYLRSLLVVPTLYPRYTIVVLPAILLLLSAGVELITNNFVKYSLLIFFCLLSWVDTVLVKKEYSEVHKTQFREMAGFIVSDKLYNYPVLTEITAWHQQYYLHQAGYNQPILEGKKEVLVDSVLAGISPKYQLEGFWLCDAHGAPSPDAALQAKIGNAYVMVKSRNFFDAWAQLYVSVKKLDEMNKLINFHDFSPSQHFATDKDTVVAIWDRLAFSYNVPIKKGKYQVNVQLRGDPAAGIFPHLSMYVDEQNIGSCSATGNYESYSFPFQTANDIMPSFKIIMDNDAVSKETKEDRNAFIKSIRFVKIGE